MYEFKDKEELLKFLNSEDGEGKEIADTVKSGLISKRDDLLSEIKTLKSKFSDVDVDELRSKSAKAEELEKELTELKRKGSQGDDKYEELKKSLEEQLQAERSKHEKFIDKYVQSSMDSRITQAISRHKGVPELLKPVVKDRIKANVNDDGEVNFEVLSKDGKPYFKDGKEASIDDIVEELKSDDLYRRAFDGTGSSGSGTRQSSGNVNTAPDMDSKDFNLTEAMKQKASRG